MDFKTSLSEEAISPICNKISNIKNKHQDNIKKPIDAILRLHSILSKESVSYSPDKTSNIISFFHGKDKVKQLILLTEGTISVERINGKILMGKSSGPGIFGMEGSEFRISLYRMKCSNSAVLKCIPYERALLLISKYCELSDYITCLRYYNDYVAFSNSILINHTALEIVCALLIELSEIPYEERLRISAVNFVRDRSNLARSGIMRIFSTLRQSSCIDIQNGKLVSLNKRLLTF